MIEIIPAIDLMNGQCVRLRQGDFLQKTRYEINPIEVAKEFERSGYKRLHVVDLDAARGKGANNVDLIQQIVGQVNLKVDVGGGLQTETQIEDLFNAGVAAVNIGSVAVACPEMFIDWLKRFGSERIWLSADVKFGRVAVRGWQDVSSETLDQLLVKFDKAGLQTAVVTAIERDGMLRGPDVKLYRSLVQSFLGLNIIASGGVSAVADLEQLEQAGVQQAIIGKALFENSAFAGELQNF